MKGQLREGETFGDYEILSVAGTGGMGIVYKARQRSLERRVALKVIREEIASAPEYRERFLREARLAASVDHPNVVSVYDVGEREGHLFLAMQWVEGEDLRRLIERSGPLEPSRAVLLASQLAEALDALHADGLIHRDVKPANVLVRSVAGKDHAYLTDFGVAEPTDAREHLTKTGLTVGTAGYLSPEQVMGRSPGPSSDLYALGCLLFEALTRHAVFRGENELALRWAHANDPRPKPSHVLPELGARYDEFFEVALAVDPKQRFASGHEFAEAIEKAHDSQGEIATRAIPIEPRVPTAIEPPRPIPPQQTPPPGTAFYPPHAYATSPAGYPQQPRSGNPLALILLAILAIGGIAVGGLAAAGLFSRAGQTSPTVTGAATSAAGAPTAPQTVSSATMSTTSSGQHAPAGHEHPLTASTTSFDGSAFSISYPASWQVKSAEQPHSYGTDTTIESPTDSSTLRRPPAEPGGALKRRASSATARWTP